MVERESQPDTQGRRNDSAKRENSQKEYLDGQQRRIETVKHLKKRQLGNGGKCFHWGSSGDKEENLLTKGDLRRMFVG